MINVTVWDNEWDTSVYEGVSDVSIIDSGHLMIIGPEGKAIAFWAPGAWFRMDIS